MHPSAHGSSDPFPLDADDFNMSYIIELRKALDEAGFADTKIVAPDLNKAAAEAFIQQWLAEPPGSPLRRATYALGFHYPNTLMSDAAHATGLPLWASEDSSTVAVPPDAPCVPTNSALLVPLAAPDGGATTRRPTPHPRAKPGGGCLARTFNQNFLNGNISSSIVWNLVTSRPLQLRWLRLPCSCMQPQPWLQQPSRHG